MLAELREYRIGMVLANQYLSQLDRTVRDSVLGNAGAVISFRVGTPDASVLAREMAPSITAQDLVHLPNYHLYLKLMIDGKVSHTFSAETFII